MSVSDIRVHIGTDDDPGVAALARATGPSGFPFRPISCIGRPSLPKRGAISFVGGAAGFASRIKRAGPRSQTTA